MGQPETSGQFVVFNFRRPYYFTRLGITAKAGSYIKEVYNSPTL